MILRVSSIFDPDRDARRAFHREYVAKHGQRREVRTASGSRFRHRLLRDVPRSVGIGSRWGCFLLSSVLALLAGLGVVHLDVGISPEHAWVLIVLAVAAALFAIIALTALFKAVHASLGARIPETVIELDDLGIHPGDDASLHVRQTGPVALERFSVALESLEIEKYLTEWEIAEDESDADEPAERITRHRDVVTREIPGERILVDEADLTIDARTPFERTLKFELPVDALPSGSSEWTEDVTAGECGFPVPPEARSVRRMTSTRVFWKIAVRGTVRRGPDFTHHYTIVVSNRGVTGQARQG